jgi:hypothetical protein
MPPIPKEETLHPIDLAYKSPYIKLAIQSLEEKDPETFKAYQEVTKNMDQMSNDGVGRVMSQFERELSQRQGPEGFHDANALGMKVKRILPLIGYAKPLVTSIAKLDPHQVAP